MYNFCSLIFFLFIYSSLSLCFCLLLFLCLCVFKDLDSYALPCFYFWLSKSVLCASFFSCVSFFFFAVFLCISLFLFYFIFLPCSCVLPCFFFSFFFFSCQKFRTARNIILKISVENSLIVATPTINFF